MTYVKSLLKYASQDLELIPKNPWQGLDIDYKTERRRVPWTSAQLDDTRSQAVPRGITWAGHDFIDTMRSQEVWERTKQAMREAGGGGFGLMLDLGKKVAEGFIRTKLKEATGIDFT